MADRLKSQELNDGAGLAAYLLVVELIGLLGGMGVDAGELSELIARARAKAELTNRSSKSKAAHTALQILESLEEKRTKEPRPQH